MTRTRFSVRFRRSRSTASIQGITGVPRMAGVPPAGDRRGRRTAPPDTAPGDQPIPDARRSGAPATADAESAAWFLDQRIEQGGMDLILDFADPVPAVLTMELVGLPRRSWRWYAELFHPRQRSRAGTRGERAADDCGPPGGGGASAPARAGDDLLRPSCSSTSATPNSPRCSGTSSVAASTRPRH